MWVDEFVQVFHTHCANNDYDSYDLLDDAKYACLNNINCSAVYDSKCDDIDEFTLCRVGFAAENSTQNSCLYQLPGKKNILFIYYFQKKQLISIHLK